MVVNSHAVGSAAWAWAGESPCALKRQDKRHMHAHRDVLLFVVRHWGAVSPQHAPDYAAHLSLMSHGPGIIVVQQIKYTGKVTFRICSLFSFLSFTWVFLFFPNPTNPGSHLVVSVWWWSCTKIVWNEFSLYIKQTNKKKAHIYFHS